MSNVLIWVRSLIISVKKFDNKHLKKNTYIQGYKVVFVKNQNGVKLSKIIEKKVSGVVSSSK